MKINNTKTLQDRREENLIVRDRMYASYGKIPEVKLQGFFVYNASITSSSGLVPPVERYE